MSSLIQVLLPVAVDRPFTYSWENPLPPGQLVIVPFRNKPVVGVVWRTSSDYSGKAKAIEEVLDLPPLHLAHLDFIQRVANYTLSPLGNVLRLSLNPDFVADKATRKKIQIGTPVLGGEHVQLSPDQDSAATQIIHCINAQEFQPFLLDGVTGSGKTEVYLAAVEAALAHQKQTLVLLPEIALTSQWLNRFERRFGCAPLQWHSGLTPSQRRQIWQATLKGEAKVVVGARSGLFLPFQDLGLMIVDEEHDGSFKQEEQVIYNARDMAVLRAHIEHCPIVLASATPSLETVQNALAGRYKTLELRTRHGGASLPTIKTIDMRQQSKGWLSAPLIQMMQSTLSKGEQVMLFLNRRGYAPLTLCKGCGYRFMCLNCSASLVEHRSSNRLHCHHCGVSQDIPKECPDCKQPDTLIPCGPGVERVHERVQKFFPGARTKIITSDEITTESKLKELIEQITNHEIDILIGTQILAKGHHFPLITLVGVIDADLGLSGGDLRCGERTYQLLHQVAGRAGREERPGVVLLQTFQPEHPLMQAIVNQERDKFVELELQERESQGMPPFGRLAALTVSGTSNELVSKTARDLGLAFPQGESMKDVRLYGPVPAPLSFVRGRHRWRLLVKCDKSFPIQSLLTHWLPKVKAPSTVQINVDVDPYNFM